MKYTAGERYTGVAKHVSPSRRAPTTSASCRRGIVDTGKRVWTTQYCQSQNWGPVLATAGGLLFTGGTNDRMFRAFDATNGKMLWEFPTESGVNGVPVSFAVDGKQYIAVQSGWGVDAARMQSRLNLLFPGQYPGSAARRRGLGVRREVGLQACVTKRRRTLAWTGPGRSQSFVLARRLTALASVDDPKA